MNDALLLNEYMDVSIVVKRIDYSRSRPPSMTITIANVTVEYVKYSQWRKNALDEKKIPPLEWQSL